MIGRFGTVLALGTVAALGYVGAHRLGRWLDGPLVDLPHDPGFKPAEPTDAGQTGWRRWTGRPQSDP
jgi:hypothetical protein